MNTNPTFSNVTTAHKHKPDSSPPLGAHMSVAGGLYRAVARAAAVNADALQIFTRNQRRWDAPPLTREEVAQFNRAFADSGLRFLCSHASYLLNLASGDCEQWRKSVESLTGEIERAAALGCRCVVVHPGSHGGDGVEAGVDRVARAALEVLNRTNECNVGIALENTAGQGNVLGGEIEELGAILDQAGGNERLGICLDTAHAFGAGVDLRSPQIVDDWAALIARRLGSERLWLLHLNDSMCECGSGKDRHTHIGRGEIGDCGFRNVLNHDLFRRLPGILETPKDKKDEFRFDRMNLRRLKRLRTMRQNLDNG